MSLFLTPNAESATTTSPRRRLGKTLLHWTRRGHLYLGLFLLPWVVLYGVTAFLFNHPTAFADAPMATFDRDALAGTPLEALPTPDELAQQVVAALNERLQPDTPYRLAASPAKYNRENAFATVRTEGQQLNVLLHVTAGSGTIRGTAEPAKPTEKAPFAVGVPAPGGRAGRGTRPPRAEGSPRGEGLKLTQTLPERMKAGLPTVLERQGFPTGEVTITSVPDLTFAVEAEGRTWTASYNALTGSVSGKPTDAPAESELTTRRFLLRMHTAHGYPSETGARWYWALVVDVLAFIMLFWSVSGLVMWWQLKGTRTLGLVILLVSASAAVYLGIGMHAALAG